MNPEDVEFEQDRYLVNWFEETKCTLVLSSYKSGSTITLSRMQVENKSPVVGTYLNTFSRVTGMFYKDGCLWLGSNYQIIKLIDTGVLKQGPLQFENCFMPKNSYYTSDVDIHDIVVDDKERIYFVSTQYNCVAKVNDKKYGFEVYWKPPWINEIVSEDRCHLNGLALRDGQPRYVTTISQSNVMGGWRENRQSGGAVYDLKEDKIICQNLSMPHSPRWHEGRLWLLESGTGYFGYLDSNNNFVRKTFIPGFARGLTFYRDQYAVICSSIDRHETLFRGLKLGETLAKNNASAKCGLFIVNLETFGIVHMYVFNRGATELYDVVLIPDTGRTRLIDLFDPLMSTINKTKPTWGGAISPLDPPYMRTESDLPP